MSAGVGPVVVAAVLVVVVVPWRCRGGAGGDVAVLVAPDLLRRET